MFSFLNPMFLLAAFAAIVPLVLHLMQRRRTVRIRFSTVRFLRLAQKRSSNRVRMENFLLWLLRTLLMLVLAAAFAIPVLRTQGFGRLMGSARRDVALVLDVSYSMGYESGRRKVWDTARDTAVSIIEGLRDGDRVCVYLADDRSTGLIEKPTSDRAMAINMIRSLEISRGSSKLHETTLAALNGLRDSSKREREVHIVTDGQSLPWSGFAEGQSNAVAGATLDSAAATRPGTADSKLNAGGTKMDSAVSAVSSGTVWDPQLIDKEIAFFVTLAGPAQPENTWPVSAELNPPLLLADTPGKLNVRFSHNGPAQSLAVALEVDGNEVSRRNALVEANGAVELAFPLPAMPFGIHAARITTPADGLAIDDEFHFLLHVRKELPTLVVGTPSDCLFLTTALNPGENAPALKAKRIDPEAVSAETLRNYSTIFLCNALPLSGQAMLALENYVKGGGVLVLFPGDNARPKDYAEWSILPGKPDAISEMPEKDRVRYLFLRARQDPVFSGFSLPPGSTPTVVIQRYLHFPRLENDASIVIAAGNETPFLVSRYAGRGRMLLSAVSADRRWSSLPLSAFFLPLIHQVVFFGAGLGREPLYLWPAPTMLLSEMFPDLTDKDVVTTPRGETLSIRPVRKEMKVLLEAENVREQGVYLTNRGGDAKEPLFAVNLKRDESNLQPVNPDELLKITGLDALRVARDSNELQRLIDNERKGRPLTEMALWAALILAIIENTLANWISRRKAVLTDHMTIDSSGRVSGGVKE